MRSVPVTFSCALATFGGVASAAVHHLFVGARESTTALYSLTFDDEAETLNATKVLRTETAHPQITFNHDQRSLYAVGQGTQKFYCYTVVDNSTLEFESTLQSLATCNGSYANFVAAKPYSPYTVYGSTFPGPPSCPTVMNADVEHGSLYSVAQDYVYAPESGVTSMTFSPNTRFMYSADFSGNAIWAHYLDDVYGKPVLVSREDVPAGSGPSQVIAHRMGQRLFVLMQESNELAQFNLDWYHSNTQYNKSFPLLPKDSDIHTINYISTGISNTANGDYIWATTSSSDHDDDSFLSVFSVNPSNGEIIEKIEVRRITKGGVSHLPTAAPFDNTLMALTYYPTGRVEIWKLDTKAAIANVVASTKIDVDGCCGNAIWYD